MQKSRVQSLESVINSLRWSYFRYLLQHHSTQEDSLLHGQLDRSLRRYILPLGARLLPTSRLRREDRTLHHHPLVADHVLPLDLGNHTVYISRTPAARQVPPVHHAAGRTLRRHHDHGAERPLPEAEHAQDGAVGEDGIHPAAAEAAVDEGSRPAVGGDGAQKADAERQQEVSESLFIVEVF